MARSKNANEKNISFKPTRGFVEATRGHRTSIWVRKGYKLVPCSGEAHKPEQAAYTDHCSVCSPLWGEVAVPETTEKK